MAGQTQKFGTGFGANIDDIATALATQQSIKAYADTKYGPGGTDVALADGGTGASLADPNADRIFFWDDSAGSTAFLTLGSTLSITDTTINAVYGVPGGTDVALADGGTGASLVDPNDDRIMFWDDSAGSIAFLDIGTGLTITDTTISSTGFDPFTEMATNTQATVIINFGTMQTSQTSSGAQFNDRPVEYEFFTSTTSGQFAEVDDGIIMANDSGSIAWAQEWDWDNDDFDFSSTIAFGDTTSQDVFVGITQSALTGAPANATYTVDHAAFMIEDGTLYASVADGTTQNRLDVTSGITLTAYNNYRITWTAATSAVFKINGNTVATLTTNRPTGETTPPILSWTVTTQTTDNRGMKILKNTVLRVSIP